MSMRCTTCQVSVNSVGQYQQHLQGKTHAKKLKQQESAAQLQNQKQSQPIMTGVGRGGGGSPMEGRKMFGRGQGGPVNFVRASDIPQQGPPNMQGMRHPGVRPGLMSMEHTDFYGIRQPGPARPGMDPPMMRPQYIPGYFNAGPANMDQRFAFGNNQQKFADKPKANPDPCSETLVFGDHMGMVSVELKGNNPLYCDVCCIKLNSTEQADFHYRGTRHIKKARVARMHEVGALTETNEDAEHGFFFCSFCNITVNSADQMTAHRQGAKHKRLVERKRRLESKSTGPAVKKTNSEFTEKIPLVKPSDILPFEQMLSSASSSKETAPKTSVEASG